MRKQDYRGLYSHLPPLRRGVQNVARMLHELQVLADILDDSVRIIFDEIDFSYILIDNYTLPLKYRPRKASLLILLHPEFPATPGLMASSYGIYIKGKGGKLTRHGKRLGCSDEFHGTDCSHGNKELKEAGWYWLCLANIEAWSETRDGLHTILFIMEETLLNPTKRQF